MKSNKRRNNRRAIVRVEQSSPIRKAVIYIATSVGTTCLGIGLNELVRWAWKAIKHLF